MRYRRLKERIDKHIGTGTAGLSPVDENTLFLYQCMVASACKPDWKVVANATGLKAGTASMRWRRLSERIEREGGADIQAKAPATVVPKPAVPRKRKSTVAVEADSDGEVKGKKIKTEASILAGKRQTRGKMLNYTDEFDSSSSATGNSTAATSTSNFEASAVDEDDDEDSMVSNVGAQRFPKTALASKEAQEAPASVVEGEDVGDEEEAGGENSMVIYGTETKTSKAAVKYIKSTPVLKRTVAPMTPQSGAPSSARNPKPSGSSVSKFSITDAPPTPVTPKYLDVVPSIESDDTHGTPDTQWQSGRMKRESHSSAASIESSPTNEVYESAVEVAESTLTSSVQAQASSDDEMSSVAPEDSVSVIGKRLSGSRSNEQKRVSQTNNNGLLGKLFGLWG